MRMMRGLEEVPRDWGRSVVTIGVFDGVHRGHQTILDRAVAAGRARDLPVVVVTFEPHPDTVVRGVPHPPVLTPPARKAELLGQCGADAVCVLPFTTEFSTLSPDDFVQRVLVDRFQAAVVVVGENFRFGHKAAGDLDTLHNLGGKYDFTAEGVRLLADADTITSTLIRRYIAEGNLPAASGELGRWHRVEGVVVRGAQRGRGLGFPTANVQPAEHSAVPADGVYGGWLELREAAVPDGTSGQEFRWPAAISVGSNPTFAGEHTSVEAYALDRDDLELYDARVAVDFVDRIRSTVRFDSVAELISEMERDVERARAMTARATVGE
ncbi:bifunctional riboflavin kinase/FAD synthetase [Lipingzhangella sp. LS1_29]|uniref:Riboflavin biosynthesis protein n=1 Tax=Lipingzhangella rawalii TaxID=2055835 RepID=A0ABU2H5I1_9ACTN|nr:bifunctional riboflavin kinase/FAD synthetase [Lipingzhangella rawalii]MDS1270569.1 bifunctional riboflavin kinase/FAD synthetase [Lipingzhangella rawalii]